MVVCVPTAFTSSCTCPQYLPEKYLSGYILAGLKYFPLAFSSMNGRQINDFTSNIMVLHHKKSQTQQQKILHHKKSQTQQQKIKNTK